MNGLQVVFVGIIVALACLPFWGSIDDAETNVGFWGSIVIGMAFLLVGLLTIFFGLGRIGTGC